MNFQEDYYQPEFSPYMIVKINQSIVCLHKFLDLIKQHNFGMDAL